MGRRIATGYTKSCGTHAYPMPKIIDLSLFSEGQAMDVTRIVDPDDFAIDVADYLKDLSWARAPAERQDQH